MFRKKLLNAGLLAALGLGAGTVFAAPYLSTSPTNCDVSVIGCAQLIEDNDWEILLRPVTGGGYEVIPITAATVVQQNDVFAGVLQIQATELVSPAGDDQQSLQGATQTFTSIFLVKADTVTCTGGTCGALDGSSDTLTFVAAGDAAWSAVFGAGGALDVSSTFNVNNINGTGQNPEDGTLAFLFNGDVYNTQTSLGTLSASATSFIDGGTLQYEFGFTGAAGELWRTTGTDAALPFYSGTTTPLNRIAMNITQQWAGPDLDKHNYRLYGSGDANFTAPVHIQGFGNVTGIASGTNWGVVTDTDLWIRRATAVPEPGTLVLLSLGLAGLGFATRSRKLG